MSGVVGGPLPPAATLGELGVLDGELLRLGPALPCLPPPVFDDPVDAVAAAAATGTRGYRFEAVVVLAVSVAAAVLLGVGGPGGAVGAARGRRRGRRRRGGTRLAQRGGDPAFTQALARGVGLAGVALAAAAGWAAVPDPPGPVPLMAAAVAAGIAAAAAQLLLRVVAPTLVAAGAVAVVCAAAVIVVRLGATPVAAATAVAALALVAAPLLPRAAIRLAGLPRPVVPADESELTGDDDPPLPPAELAERADLARGYLAGLAGAAAVLAAAGALVAASGGGWAGPVFAGVTAMVLLLRARGYADLAPARTALAAGIAVAIGLAAAVGGPGSPLGLGACAVLLVGAGAGIAALDAAARGMRPELSPVLRRTVDVVEGVLVAAAVPLALAAMDLFALVRGW